ncbi:phosphopantetheine-binding protein [Amycolatopsis sp. NPDC051102]|uniref:phosphopantetheine-binding protein n=1 Tax=Amycolatopsis sp. NPDC051102 TaxID=3155163 RepID=UPI00341D40FA
MDSRERSVSVDMTNRNSIEEYLASIWRQLFSLDHVNYLDNFFELGGDSVIALELVATLNDVLDVEIDISVIYERPTISELSDYIASGPE